MTYIGNNYNKIGIWTQSSPELKFTGVQSFPLYEPKSIPKSDYYKSYDDSLEFYDKNRIESLSRSNPAIMSQLKSAGIPLRVNIDELQKLKAGHMTGTYVTAAKIYSALPAELKNDINKNDLMLAAKYHDYGKVLIPKDILNKAGKLNEREKEIMDLHSIFGAELLKSQGMSEGVTQLVKYHHQVPDGSGYPVIDDNFEYGIPSQILYAADKYNALTEKRSYKDALSKSEALNIIQEDADNNVISSEVFNTLKKVV